MLLGGFKLIDMMVATSSWLMMRPLELACYHLNIPHSANGP